MCAIINTGVSHMGVAEILIIIVCAALVIGVFVYSAKQYKDEKRPPVDFIRELFNHFGDGSNYKR